MRTSMARLAASAALAGSAAAIMVTSGSSCDQSCGNVLDATTPSDIVCQNSEFGSSSAAGTVMENCLNCEISSTYYTTSPNETDQQWLLYNARYTLSECLWGEPGNVSVGSSPCTTSRACGLFQNAFQYANFSTNTSIGAYDYCDDWQDDTSFDACVTCLRSLDNHEYLANMLVALQVGCDQKPTAGSTISVSGSIFSKTLMNETTPTPTSSWTTIGDSGPLSLGAKAGIAIGGLCALLALAGFCVVCTGRRRRRAFLRKLEMQHRDSGWPHPGVRGAGAGGLVVHRGPDMNETPLSQKPLRGWDDSPQSATASDVPSSGYGRYFSPYSSQQTSPVNGAEAAAAMAWPREFHTQPVYGAEAFPAAAAQDHRREEETAVGAAAAPLPIGLALGGDEPSLRSKVSDQSVQSKGVGGPGKEVVDNIEEYELHDVSSSAGGSSAGGGNNNMAGSSNSFRNRVARDNRAPVLQHPGYGRYSPERMFPPPPAAHTISGGLRDDVEGGYQM